MKKKAHYATGSEKVISLILLAALVVIAGWVWFQQSHYDLERYGIIADVQAGPLPLAASNLPLENLTAVLGPNYQPFSALENYDADTLFEKINGKAPLYTDAGFQQLFCRRFIHRDQPDLWMEVYLFDMATPHNAFCVFSAQRRPDSETLEFFVGRRGYRSGNGLFGMCGHYYLELIGSVESDELWLAMRSVAKALAEKLAEFDEGLDNDLSLWPQEDLRDQSFKYKVNGAFGCKELDRVFSAAYQIDEQPLVGFFSRRDDDAAANDLAATYTKFLVDNGGQVLHQNHQDYSGTVIDIYGMFEIIFTTGNYVVGIHEADELASGEKLVRRLFTRLSEVEARN